MRFRFSLSSFGSPIGALLSALQGVDRVAGVVIEHERVRFAEFRAVPNDSARGSGRVLVSEGAVFLPKGTIREGALVRPEVLAEALTKLTREGKPRPLSTTQIILAVPTVHLVGSTVQVPIAIQKGEIENVLQLEIEGTLPFSLTESYIDWQTLHGEEGMDTHTFLFAGVRKTEIDPYIQAAEDAGLGVVAVEPVTLSITRGLEHRSGITYIAAIYPDALLAAAIDARGDVRFFHHRSIPALADGGGQELSGGRAQRLALELIAFIRFLREQFSEEQQELLIDGILDEATLQVLEGLSETLGIPVRLEHATHTLSRAATRGVALRGMLPRRQDTLVSLMPIGTEHAYAERQASFFLRAGMRLVGLGAVIGVLLLAGAWGFLFNLERTIHETARQAQAAIPEGVQATLDDAKRLNGVIDGAVGLLQAHEIPVDLPEMLLAAVPDRVSVHRIVVQVREDGIRAEIAGAATTSQDLLAARDIIRECFATSGDALQINPNVLINPPPVIPFVFPFTLNPNYQLCPAP